MNKSQDGSAFASLMLAMSEMYGKEVSTYGMDMWFEDLQKYTIEQVRRGFSAHRADPKNGKFWPKPSDIIRHVDGLPEEVATVAWSKVMQAISRYGSWESVCFDDQNIHTVITLMGGWVKVCEITVDDISYKQKEFEKLYLSAEQNKHHTSPRYLAGHSELANISSGFKTAPPMMIGDKSKCQVLLDSSESKPAVNLKLKSIGDAIETV